MLLWRGFGFGWCRFRFLSDRFWFWFRFGRGFRFGFGRWFGRMMTGNFGYSFEDGKPVLDKILQKIPISLQLSVT